MKIGKIPETALKRSVFKQIRHRRDEVLIRPGIGVDCSIIELAEDEVFVLSTDPITGLAEEIGAFAIYKTINNLVCGGAEAIGVMLSMLLPCKSGEQQIKRIIRDIEEECQKLNIEIIGGHTEYTPAVNQPILTVTGIGKAKKGEVLSTKTIKPGQEIVMTKWAGLEGTAILAKAKEEELKSRYTSYFIEEAKELTSFLSVIPEATLCHKMNVTAMHDVTEGGIFGALWELVAAADVGLLVDLTQIPIKQETIEVCEFYDLNPYMLKSSGSLLIVTEEANHLVDELEKQGIKATVIGRITEGHERIVFNEDERRYLQPTRFDEVYKVIAE